MTINDELPTPSEEKNKPTETTAALEEGIDTESQEFSWAMVSLKIGFFNIIIFALLFLLYKYLPRIKQKMIPPLFEEATDG